jgi:hypothetical protein
MLSLPVASVETFFSDFENYQIGEMPSEWRSKCDGNCDGYSMVADNFSFSSPNSLECHGEGTEERKCILDVETTSQSYLSLNYSLNTSGSQSESKLGVLDSNYNIMKELNKSSGSNKSGHLERFYLGKYDDTDISIGAVVSHGGYAFLDDFELSSSRLIEPVFVDEYSKVVVDAGVTRIIRAELVNDTPFEKNLTVFLEGPEAQYSGGDDKLRLESFEPGENRRLNIRLSPEKVGDARLEIISRDNDLGLNRSASKLVAVSQSQGESVNVPGITGFQVLFILFSATFLYFVRL